ncbi:MAG: hypothetical protein KKF46_07025 [Nanoarchaeota archaeon]|nr:hypothetical protein [Nanoarchaeota archaeon]MBU1322081.1 hypothetical protein [Nanoarchaeota archaeon]MBU1598187.1 hypothetical protein [Nanoarchaeota archaeon]MBU2441317.1 hypothetical protein [Nanoarchaeota archaeon]
MSIYEKHKQNEIEEALGIKLPILVLTNPMAGANSRKIADYMKEKFGSEYFHHYISPKPDGIQEMISQEISKLKKYPDYKLMAIVNGGDGTFQKVANLHPNIDKLIGCYLPGGTSCDFPLSLGINGNRDIPRTANLIKKILDQHLRLEDYVKKIDLIKVNYDEKKEIYGFNIFGIGIDGLICNEVNDDKKRGGFFKKLRFVQKAIKIKTNKKRAKEPQLFKPLEIGYMLNYDQKNTNDDADSSHFNNIFDNILAFNFLNGKRAASGLYRYSNFALDDGVGRVVITKNMKLERGPLFLLEHQLAHALKTAPPKERKEHDNVRNILLSVLNYDEEENLDYYLELDGEPYKIDNPKSGIKIEIVPKATNVFCLHKTVAEKEIDHRHMYRPDPLEISDPELRKLSELAEKDPIFYTRII